MSQRSRSGQRDTNRPVPVYSSHFTCELKNGKEWEEEVRGRWVRNVKECYCSQKNSKEGCSVRFLIKSTVKCQLSDRVGTGPMLDN